MVKIEVLIEKKWRVSRQQIFELPNPVFLSPQILIYAAVKWK
jgi:hypothetical protein